MGKPKQEKMLPDWERRLWPAEGEAKEEPLFYHVGRFLSLWEKLEAGLAFLFATFSGPYPSSEPARRAIFAVRTFEGRVAMLKAASTAFFETVDDMELQDECKELIISAQCYSLRRNDIAHGLVSWFATEEEWQKYGAVNNHNTYALYPSIASFKERDLLGKPTYCMTSKEIEFYFSKIVRLQNLSHILSDKVTSIERPPFPQRRVRQHVM
jgi:hypothetical protein